jgi:predicted acyltransferase (DUF342 family)
MGSAMLLMNIKSVNKAYIGEVMIRVALSGRVASNTSLKVSMQFVTSQGMESVVMVTGSEGVKVVASIMMDLVVEETRDLVISNISTRRRGRRQLVEVQPITDEVQMR